MHPDVVELGPRPTVRSVRVRITLAAVAVVAVATTIGSLLVVLQFRWVLTDELISATEVRAGHIAAGIAVRPVEQPQLEGDLDDGDFAQVISAAGVVLAASSNAVGLPPLVWPAPSAPQNLSAPFDGPPLVAVAQPVESSDGSYVLVAKSTESIRDELRLLGTLFLVALPSLWLIIAVLTWSLVGRALRPVDAIRRSVDEISSTAMHLRVPEAGGDDEIARLSRTMNRMLDRLEQAQVRQRQFTSDASHELRSPVAAIRQYAEVAMMHPERVVVSDLARDVLAESSRVQDLVEDLLLLARLDERASRLRTLPVDLDDLVFAEARRLRERGTLRIDTSSVGAGRVRGDQRALGRVLRNLTDNAARHAESRVSFTLVTRDRVVELVVDDDGPGIPVNERDRVLVRFVRLEDARDRDSGGTGLGLAIVAEVVAAHGGEVRLETSPSGGARVSLTFPLANGEFETPAEHPVTRRLHLRHRSG